MSHSFDNNLVLADPYQLCDNDRDGDCDLNDYNLVKNAIGQCDTGNQYNSPADADHDGCVTAKDLKQLFPVIPKR